MVATTTVIELVLYVTLQCNITENLAWAGATKIDTLSDLSNFFLYANKVTTVSMLLKANTQSNAKCPKHALLRAMIVNVVKS